MADLTKIEWTDRTWVHSMYGANKSWSAPDSSQKGWRNSRRVRSKGFQWREVVHNLQTLAYSVSICKRQVALRWVGVVLLGIKERFVAISIYPSPQETQRKNLCPSKGWGPPSSETTCELLCRGRNYSESLFTAVCRLQGNVGGGSASI